MFSHHNKELFFALERIMNVIQSPLYRHSGPLDDFIHPAKLLYYRKARTRALHACQPTWRIRPLNVGNRVFFHSERSGDPEPTDLSPTPPPCPMHQSAPHIKTTSLGQRETMVLCPTGGFGVSICPHCSPAWGNLRPLDQTRAEMNSDVEHLKKPFCVFFFGYESDSVCLKACVRPSQCPTWQRLWIIKQKPKGYDNNSKFEYQHQVHFTLYVILLMKHLFTMKKDRRSLVQVWLANKAHLCWWCLCHRKNFLRS